MDKKQLKQTVGAIGLIVLAAGVLFWSFTRSDEEPLVLSQATLKGVVTYKGKPVSHAMIIVATESGVTVAGTGNSDANGNYYVQYVPTGPVKIGVNTDAGKAMMRGATIAAAVSGDKSQIPKFADVPPKYFNPDTSGITTVLSNVDAVNEFNIEIK